jgi:Zn-dependent M28 family amino/carboxypeptidase
VLALLPGADPDLRAEHVLFTAHLDHLGTRTDRDGDGIYNGAYDNAAGVAIVLEVAAVLAGMSPPPRRSVLFAAVTAEEKGLLGSDFLARHSPAGIGNTVANINVDMPFLGHPVADVEGLGVEHSTLHGSLGRAAEQCGMALTPDPRPELVRLIRSDQFSFVKQGIPGLNLKPGSTSSDPEVDGGELRDAFLHDHYHQPSDDLALPFSEEGAGRFLCVAVALGRIIADAEESPRWKEGDFFGDRYAPVLRPSLGSNGARSRRPSL